LLASAEEAGAVSRMMQAIGRRYVRAFNAKYARTGTLWEGRFRSCLVDSERYLLTCLRYIELNPVCAGLVALPWDYRWSSVHAHLGLRPCPLSRPHPVYAALGADAATRAARYRELLLEPLDDEHLSAVREHMRQERALGSPQFQAMVGWRRRCGVRSACVKPDDPYRHRIQTDMFSDPVL
jgi:putative transposase